MLLVFFLLVLSVFLISRNLLLVLLILEIIGFVLVYLLSSVYSVVLHSDFVLLTLFSILVIEGVIALSGLISLVSFSGGDYIGLSSFTNI